MPNFTPNLNLKKPLTTEYYNVADFNDNMDIIDTDVQAIINDKPKEQYTEDLSSVNITATSYADVLTMNISNNGTYIVFYSADFNSHPTYNTAIRILHNSTTLGVNSISSGINGPDVSFSGSKKITAVVGDTLTIQAQTGNAAGPVTVSRSSIYIKEYKGV